MHGRKNIKAFFFCCVVTQVIVVYSRYALKVRMSPMDSLPLSRETRCVAFMVVFMGPELWVKKVIEEVDRY